MSMTIEERNQMVRRAVEGRMEAQAAGKPAHEWYDADTDPMPDGIKSEVSHHFPRGPSAAEVLERFAPTRPGSLPFLELLEEVRQLHLSKSQDYGSEADPLANIRQGAEFVGIEPWRGCMVRIADKVQRLKTYCQTGRLVHEGVRDTLMDLAAYSLLAIVLFDEGKDG